jgi:uncharacterized membrane protein
MRAWLEYLSEQTIVVIDGLALLTIVIATLEVCIAATHAALKQESHHLLRAIWLRYARWLVAALTLQLAADIIETSISTSWQAIGRVGAIAVIRTALNFFLDRDVGEMRARDQERAAVDKGSS